MPDDIDMFRYFPFSDWVGQPRRDTPMITNYAGLAFKAELEKNPDLFTITDASIKNIEKQQAARRKKEDKERPTELLSAELVRLRSQLFAIEQNVKGMEIRANHAEVDVREFEKRITEAIKNKKQHEKSGNLLGARSVEHGIQLLEGELDDARASLAKYKRFSAGAVRELQTWQTENGPRLKELEKEVG